MFYFGDFHLDTATEFEKGRQTFSVDIRTLNTSSLNKTKPICLGFHQWKYVFFVLTFPSPLMIVPLNVLNGTRVCAYRVTDHLSYSRSQATLLLGLNKSFFFFYKQYGREKRGKKKTRCWTTAMCVVQVTIFFFLIYSVSLCMTLTKQAVNNFLIYALACRIRIYGAGVRFGLQDRSVRVVWCRR